jgi:hypothetical protein
MLWKEEVWHRTWLGLLYYNGHLGTFKSTYERWRLKDGEGKVWIKTNGGE